MSGADADFIAAYEKTRSVHKAAKELGVAHSTVHRRLIKLGIARQLPAFTEAEKARLISEYNIAANAGKLKELPWIGHGRRS